MTGFHFDDHKLRVLMARLERDLPEFLTKVGRMAQTRIAGRAIGSFMRNAKGEGPRSAYDRGPLRIVGGRLARSLSQPRNPEAIRKIEVQGGVARVEIGSHTPYARIHEEGGQAGRNRSVTIAARPYLEPAMQGESEEIQKRAQRMFSNYVYARA